MFERATPWTIFKRWVAARTGQVITVVTIGAATGTIFYLRDKGSVVPQTPPEQEYITRLDMAHCVAATVERGIARAGWQTVWYTDGEPIKAETGVDDRYYSGTNMMSSNVINAVGNYINGPFFTSTNENISANNLYGTLVYDHPVGLWSYPPSGATLRNDYQSPGVWVDYWGDHPETNVIDELIGMNPYEIDNWLSGNLDYRAASIDTGVRLYGRWPFSTLQLMSSVIWWAGKAIPEFIGNGDVYVSTNHVWETARIMSAMRWVVYRNTRDNAPANAVSWWGFQAIPIPGYGAGPRMSVTNPVAQMGDIGSVVSTNYAGTLGDLVADMIDATIAESFDADINTLLADRYLLGHVFEGEVILDHGTNYMEGSESVWIGKPWGDDTHIGIMVSTNISRRGAFTLRALSEPTGGGFAHGGNWDSGYGYDIDGAFPSNRLHRVEMETGYYGQTNDMLFPARIVWDGRFERADVIGYTDYVEGYESGYNGRATVYAGWVWKYDSDPIVDYNFQYLSDPTNFWPAWDNTNSTTKLWGD